MFYYTKGYEIDGSDSSYNLITPDKKLLIEVVLKFLSLKHIINNQRFKINYYKKRKYYSLHSYRNEVLLDIDELEDFLNSNLDIDYIDIEFTYRNFDSLYRSVKREIFDLYIKFFPHLYKNISLNNPTVFNNDSNYIDFLSVSFTPENSRRIYNTSELNIYKTSYLEENINKDFNIIEFTSSIGSSFPHTMYSIYKISGIFPS